MTKVGPNEAATVGPNQVAKSNWKRRNTKAPGRVPMHGITPVCEAHPSLSLALPKERIPQIFEDLLKAPRCTRRWSLSVNIRLVRLFRE